ncbi:MAG: hypothetical protein KAY59_02400 [Acidobacteria bacterium]|nr:hypothetical protein [Acidobacteriota bacterium]
MAQKKIHEEFDAFSGRSKVWTYDGERVVQHTQQDVQPLLDHNAAQRNDPGAAAAGKKKGFMKVGSIPLELVQKWHAEEGFNIFSPDVPTSEVLRRLRMAEYEKLRTTDAKF